jgi:DNA polymerase-3 subunit gamma/tau
MDEAPCEDEAVAAAPTQPATAPAVVSATAAPGGRATVSSLPQAVQRTPLGDRWYEVVTTMVAAGSIAALARELAMQAELCEIQQADATEIWRLTVERDSLRTVTNADKLLAALRAVTGQGSLQLDLVAGVAQDSPARRDAEAAALRQQEAEQAIQGDPLVQAMLSQFRSARIVPGSIKPV